MQPPAQLPHLQPLGQQQPMPPSQPWQSSIEPPAAPAGGSKRRLVLIVAAVVVLLGGGAGAFAMSQSGGSDGWRPTNVRTVPPGTPGR